MTVVLFGLLIGAGAGSLLSPRVATRRGGPPGGVFAVLCVLIVAYTMSLAPLFQTATRLGFGARLALALAVVAGIGVPLGMPFPLGLRAVQATAPPLAPWAIGVNGFASVIGATAAVPIAMLAGLRVLLLLAVVLYAIAGLTTPRSPAAS